MGSYDYGNRIECTLTLMKTIAMVDLEIYPTTVVLEAGELTTQFRLDTSLLDNDIYIFDEDDRYEYELGELEFKLVRRHVEDRVKWE